MTISVLACGSVLVVLATASATTLADYGINDRFVGSSVIYNTIGSQPIGRNLASAATSTRSSKYLDGLTSRASLPINRLAQS